ncbi:endo-1,4-beta-xylanase 5-like [Carya illinoinensis]|uniref:endo-1,4-beta-xylanase 5-like n=1 Tax=Carya illinoinensis TaxID=32201 RepID=UPI001C719C33|nr:endo-1,4-beta-xylanase 5-like [Carya illinoinensis]
MNANTVRPLQFLSRNSAGVALAFSLWACLLVLGPLLVASYDGPLYNHTAYTECKSQPEKALYKGGILKSHAVNRIGVSASNANSQALILNDLSHGTIYSFSSWVKIKGADSAPIRASLKTENTTYYCIGTVLAQRGCWSFLKGRFVLSSPSNFCVLFLQNPDNRNVSIEIASTSVQPFTEEQWRTRQQYMINSQRKRTVTIHVSDGHGEGLRGATIDIKQVSKDFPLGSAIAQTILGNLPYQKPSVDLYISRLRELERDGVSMDGIGLEGHFDVPNSPLMRATIDRLATLGLPIWLTEVDISNTFDKEQQAIYLVEVLREGFSHPSVNGIMLWTALHPNGCYRMCLTDNNFQNLPAGDVVDKLLKEWQTGEIEGETDVHGSYSFHGFLGEYQISVKYGNRTANSTISLCRGDETKHYNIQI